MVLISKFRMSINNLNVAKTITIDKTKLVAGPFKPASQINIDELQLPDQLEAARPYHPCSIFFNRTLSKFINKSTRKGQKTLVRDFMRESFCIIKRTQLNKFNQCINAEEQAKIVCNPLVIFLGALENCKPLLITKPVKRGGATYQVPFPLSERESEEFAMRWLFQAIVDRPKPKTAFFPEVMARELIDCFNNEGKVVKRKQDVHKQCEANKAYAHYRWN